jgi:hypothetical protein
LGVAEQTVNDWYCLLREAQGGLLAWISAEGSDTPPLRIMFDSSNFLADSLFCEYAYIINLDDKTFEVYEGFQKTPGNGRYAQLMTDWQRTKEVKGEFDERYYGVSLIATIPLAQVLKAKSEDDIDALLAIMDPPEPEDEDDDVGDITTDDEVQEYDPDLDEDSDTDVITAMSATNAADVD